MAQDPARTPVSSAPDARDHRPSTSTNEPPCAAPNRVPICVAPETREKLRALLLTPEFSGPDGMGYTRFIERAITLMSPASGLAGSSATESTDGDAMTLDEAIAFLTERLPGMARMAEEYRSPEGRRTTEATRLLLDALRTRAAHESGVLSAADQAEFDRITALGVQRIDTTGGRLAMDLTVSREIATLFAEWASFTLDSTGAENYVEMQFRHPARPEMVTVTVQRWLGQTPNQLQRAAEAEAATLRDEVMRLAEDAARDATDAARYRALLRQIAAGQLEVRHAATTRTKAAVIVGTGALDEVLDGVLDEVLNATRASTPDAGSPHTTDAATDAGTAITARADLAYLRGLAGDTGEMICDECGTVLHTAIADPARLQAIATRYAVLTGQPAED